MIRVGVALLAAVIFAGKPANVKTVTLTCSPGWRASAGGQYGGVGFTIDCQNGRGTRRLVGTTGTTYSVRMGVESDAVGGDCFYSGDAQAVNETCLQVRLSIH